MTLGVGMSRHVRTRRGTIVALIAALLAGATAGTSPAADAPRVLVLVDPALQPVHTPAGLSPEWIIDALPGATVADPSTIDAGAGDVLVNPYGEAYPATAAVHEALADGAAFVNLAGEPLRRPGGVNDGANPHRFGIVTREVHGSRVSGTEPTQLGAARLPSLAATSDTVGVAIHAIDPLDERVLSRWFDHIGGVPAGPAILSIEGATRVVAVAHRGDASPVAPGRPGAASLLGDLVAVAAGAEPRITDVAFSHDPGRIHVEATASGGTLAGTGTSPAPPPWSPDAPVVAHHAVSLFDGGRLVDQVVVPANPAVVTAADGRVLLNGEPVVLKGMSSGGSAPPGLSDAETAAVIRRDFQRMHEVGVNAYRVYSPLDDWTLNTAAANGLLVADTIGFGWVIEATTAKVDAQVPWARFVGARARTTHNVISVGLGNEWLDHDRDRALAGLERLAQEARTANGGVHPIVYTASHDEPMLLGELPFLDLYAVNCYGLTYPTSAPDPAFALCIEHGKVMAGDRPFLVSEWGANTFLGDGAQAAAQHHVGLDAQAQESLRAQLVYEKWLVMEALSVAGGYAFQWSDGLGKCLVTREHCTATNVVENPPGSGYTLLNHEQWWGFHDVNRRPRLALHTLEHLYLGRPGLPPGILPTPSVAAVPPIG